MERHNLDVRSRQIVSHLISKEQLVLQGANGSGKSVAGGAQTIGLAVAVGDKSHRYQPT
jgi:hypothetical protein